jgi:hypothetical protein
MFHKAVFILAVFALIVSAGTVPVGVQHYKVTLFEAAAVPGAVLPAGDYKLELKDNKLTFVAVNGKVPVEVTVKVETGDKKFDGTSVRLDTAAGKAMISEIRLGGTKTRLVFN